MIDPATATFIDPETRDEVVVTGDDAATYLHSQLSQSVADLDVGAARWTFVLEPTGKVTALARITRTAEQTYVLDTDAGFGAAVKARLDRFKIRVDATTELVEATVPHPSPAHETARIAAGWPRMGAEIVPGETIPATTGVVALAVDFTKGCFPGQELVERMDSRGADAPRALRIVEVPDGTTVGDAIRAGGGVDGAGADVGVVTSVSGTQALGYVKRGADVGRVPEHA